MIENIEKIIKIFEKSKVSKMDLEINDIKIKLEKNDPIISDNIYEVKQEETVLEVSSNTHVKSPVVGTYYQARGEKKPPFIVKGQKVKKGDVLCIIEAMKVMNEITSPIDGTVLDILVENEGLVEFDQDLIIIGEPND